MMQKWTSKRKLLTLLHWLNQGPCKYRKATIQMNCHKLKKGISISVTINIFPGWVEALPPTRNTATGTVKMLSEKIVHRYGTAAETERDEEQAEVVSEVT